MFEFLIDLASGYGGGVSAIGLGVLGAYMKFENRNLTKLIIEGSEDVKHEQAVRTFRNAFREAIHGLGYEIRNIERDLELRGQIPTLTHRYNAVWLDVRKTMLNSVKDFTYKGKPLELYLHSTLTDWTTQRDMILDNLIKAINGQPTEVQNLEKKLSSFKRTLCYGSENWLDKNLLHQEEEPVKKVKIEKEEESKAEVPALEVASV
tara:strand:+ start:16483 stop:17100 length:618 start_codon:yes stop_codon:yes gene_type:complete